MSAYLLINISIILIPLLLSFDAKVNYFKKLLPVFISIVVVGIIFIAWDVLAVSRGDWAFNEEYISGIRIINLPIEEVLFFITVPYSIFFINKCLKYYVKDSTYSIGSVQYSLTAAVFFLTAMVFINKSYTSTVLFFCCAIFVLLNVLHRYNFISKTFLLTLLISVVPFFIVNYLLTSLPVVVYNEYAITGIRILSIPAEDFLYSFSMISSWLIVHDLAAKQTQKLVR